MEKKLGQEPAFSRAAFANEYGIDKPEGGMSKRFYAACAAMQGLIANPNIARPNPDSNIGTLEDQYKDFSKICYEYADALLRQENE